jgi:hypothetical protein
MEDYDLQNAILKENAKPSSASASPSITKPVVDYAKSKSASNADTVIASQKMAQNEKQFLAQLVTAHDKLNTWSQQNDLATLIAAANVPVRVMANNKLSDSMDKQTAMTQKIIDMDAESRKSLADAATNQTKMVNDFINPPPPLVPNSPLLVPDESPKLSDAAKWLDWRPQPLDYRRNN